MYVCIHTPIISLRNRITNNAKATNDGIGWAKRTRVVPIVHIHQPKTPTHKLDRIPSILLRRVEIVAQTSRCLVDLIVPDEEPECQIGEDSQFREFGSRPPCGREQCEVAAFELRCLCLIWDQA